MVVLAIASPRADIIEQVLVKVNGEIITKTDLGRARSRRSGRRIRTCVLKAMRR